MKKWLISLTACLLFTGVGTVSAAHGHEAPKHPNSLHFQSKPQSEASLQRMVKLYNAKGEEIGNGIVKQEEKGVRVSVSVKGLPPGPHGFHIHEKMFKPFDFKTSGEHMNPTQKQHGFENPKGFHLGDMTNLEVKEDGTGEASFLIEGANLQKGSPYSLLGRSIMIHEKADDYKTDPAGNSGNRIAGGNIME